MIGIHALWQATDLNSLSFDLGIGYQEYVQHTQAGGLILSPDSRAQFNLFRG